MTRAVGLGLYYDASRCIFVVLYHSVYRSCRPKPGLLLTIRCQIPCQVTTSNLQLFVSIRNRSIKAKLLLSYTVASRAYSLSRLKAYFTS